MSETEICNRLLRLLGGPEAVELFLAAPHPFLRGQCPQHLLDCGKFNDLAIVVDNLRVRLE
jgi:hypothetical protein